MARRKGAGRNAAKKCRQRHRESCSRRYGGQCGEKRRQAAQAGNRANSPAKKHCGGCGKYEKRMKHAYEIGELDHYLFGPGKTITRSIKKIRRT